MTFEPSCHREVIDTVWVTTDAYSAAVGVLPVTGKSHRQRNNIPSDYWERACADAQLRGFHLTEGTLAKTQRHRKPTVMCRSKRREKCEEVAA